MTSSIEDPHVYLRSITADEHASLSVLARLIHKGATVLDLGCGSGGLGQFLKETLGCIFDGVTLSPSEAAHARPHYRRVEVADLESADLLGMFDDQRYDYIVCADVLEHLRRPEAILSACRELLASNGKLLFSVPNIAYSGLLAELLEGEFRYREEGLLDRTHLRFFTRHSLLRFMAQQRWEIDTFQTIDRALPESEFKAAFDRLPPSVARYLLGSPDALAYQFVGAARPVAHASTAVPDAAPDNQAQACFTAQLYLGYGEHFREDCKLTRAGVIGCERQTLSFDLAPNGQSLTQLRLDPADRPGFLHFYGITLSDPDGNALWEWQADSTRSLLTQSAHHHILGQVPPASGAALLLLTGEDPWIQLPIPPTILAAGRNKNLHLEVELGWPMSADYMALAGAVHSLENRIETLRENAEASDASFQEQLQQFDEITRRNHALEESNEALKHQCISATARSSSLEESNKALAQKYSHWQQEAARLQNDFANLASHLKTIENSTVFRMTRPLVHAKMGLDRMLGRAPKNTPAPSSMSAVVPVEPASSMVDVIVPVYRGLADTRRCIESVLASQCRAPWRLIVINDCSPEPEVTAWLREFAAQEPRMVLLENTENLGFVGTVNRGMAHSDANDVLLLNSDTEVANDWLDRIRLAAYSDRKIASVTPFSNNATICSYPRFCQDNVLPAGYDTARMDALCARTSPGVAIDVPTGVGFCMYIRRDCLKDVGLFDTKNFGKGYGEENDFCQRAAAAGWRNLHLLDTFVLHTGGISFGDTKSPREKAAMETLRRLHPHYERDVMAFVQADPARSYRLALDAARIQEAGQPVVLAVLHDRAGGTLRHARELALHLGEQAQFLMLTPRPARSVSLHCASEAEGFELQFNLATQGMELLQILRQLRVAHIHYHHLLGHDESILDLPQQLGVSYDFTAHDFYSYCLNISLTGRDSRYTGESTPGECLCCAPDSAAPYGGTVSQWRQRNSQFLTAARHVFAPSHDTARRIGGLAPGARLKVVSHTDLEEEVPQPSPKPTAHRDNGFRLKVVVLGALSAIKGADVLEAVAQEAARRDAMVEFHLLGYAYRHLQTQPRARLTVHGAYEDRDLPQLLAWLQPDVAWFPAQWPETYSYTLSACLEAGLPVVASDLGAFPERLAGREWSWVEHWDQSPAQWVHTFLKLRDQHFALDQPPGPAPATGIATAGSPWHYKEGYLQGVPASSSTAPLTVEFLRMHQTTPVTATGARSVLLNHIVRLRSHPLLRGVAQHIPHHWQRKLKNWLQA